jgi:hypothetical protein
MAKNKTLIVTQLNAIIADERLSGSRRLLAACLRGLAKAESNGDTLKEAFYMQIIASEFGFGRRTAALVTEEGNTKPVDPQNDKAALQGMKEMLAELSGGVSATVQS